MEGGEKFLSPTFGALTLSVVAEKIWQFLSQDAEGVYQIIIGSDSQARQKESDFVAAIVVHYRGHGGIYFWTKRRYQRFATLRERIYQEALLSLEVASSLVEELHRHRVLDFNLEIHVDIGLNGETRKFVREVVGLIQGNGFRVKTKPEAYGASTVADWYA